MPCRAPVGYLFCLAMSFRRPIGSLPGASLSGDVFSEAYVVPYRRPVWGLFVWQCLFGGLSGVFRGPLCLAMPCRRHKPVYLFYGISLFLGRISLFLVDTTRKHYHPQHTCNYHQKSARTFSDCSIHFQETTTTTSQRLLKAGHTSQRTTTFNLVHNYHSSPQPQLTTQYPTWPEPRVKREPKTKPGHPTPKLRPRARRE
jgi:hypothetical protein